MESITEPFPGFCPSSAGTNDAVYSPSIHPDSEHMVLPPRSYRKPIRTPYSSESEPEREAVTQYPKNRPRFRPEPFTLRPRALPGFRVTIRAFSDASPQSGPGSLAPRPRSQVLSKDHRSAMLELRRRRANLELPRPRVWDTVSGLNHTSFVFERLRQRILDLMSIRNSNDIIEAFERIRDRADAESPVSSARNIMRRIIRLAAYRSQRNAELLNTQKVILSVRHSTNAYAQAVPLLGLTATRLTDICKDMVAHDHIEQIYYWNPRYRCWTEAQASVSQNL